MSDPLDRVKVLLKSANIDSITPLRFTARRRQEGEAAPESVEPGEAATQINLEASTPTGRLGYRFTATAETHEAFARAEVEIWYTTGEDTEEPEGVSLEFANRVAFFTVYPFLREIIFSSIQRLGIPGVILPMILGPSAGFDRPAVDAQATPDPESVEEHPAEDG